MTDDNTEPIRSSWTKTPAEILREPFPPELVGKLPKVTCSNCAHSSSKVCPAHNKRTCDTCGNHLTTAHIHLDYVGHAVVTDRLLKADERWNWAPRHHDVDKDVLLAAIATGDPAIVQLVIENAPPKFDAHNGLWIDLTIDGVTRIGYGNAPGKTGSDAVKEIIGDGLRNAAMRFGVALDKWSKEDLDSHTGDDGGPTLVDPAAEPKKAKQSKAKTEPAPEPEQQDAAAVDVRVEQAQVFADLAATKRTVATLRGVHDSAKAQGLLGFDIVVPGTGEVAPLLRYITDRRAEIERSAAPEPKPDKEPSQEDALAAFYSNATTAGLSKSQADRKFWAETGKAVADATPADLAAFEFGGAS